MKIVHVILSKGFSGSEKYVIDVLNEQSKQNQCYLIKNKKNNFSNFYQDLNSNIKVYNISSLFSFFHINFLINLIKPNIVHTHLGEASKKVVKRNFFKLVSTIHMNFKLKYYKNHDGLIVSNSTQENQIKKEFKKNVKKIYLWPSISNKKNNYLNLREKYQIPKDSFIFGSIGRFHYQKGYDVIIEAFRKVKNKNIFLFLIGNEHFKFIKYQDEKVKLLPFQQRPEDYYQIFDCFINASRWETFGFTLVEAMQFKLPIISTLHEGNKDWLNTFNIDIFDLKNLNQLIELINKRALKKEKINYDLSSFNKKNNCEKINEFYNQI